MLTFRLHAAHIYWCCKSVPSGSYIYKEPNKLPNLKFPIKPRAEINKRANVHELIRMENCVYISTKLYLIADHCSLRCCQKWGQIPLPSFQRFWNFPAAPPFPFFSYTFSRKSLWSVTPSHPTPNFSCVTICSYINIYIYVSIWHWSTFPLLFMICVPCYGIQERMLSHGLPSKTHQMSTEKYTISFLQEILKVSSLKAKD